MSPNATDKGVDEELVPRKQNNEAHSVKQRCGRKWCVLLVCTLSNFIVYGCLPSFGVFLPEILNTYGSSNTVAVWIGSLEVGMLYLIGPLATYLIHLTNYRLVVIGGSILSSSGFLFSMLCQTIHPLYFTFGIMIGSGGGFISAGSVMALRDYFESEFATASGVMFAGGAIGLSLYPILIDKLQSYYGFKMSLLIHAGLFLNAILCGAVLRPRRKPRLKMDSLKIDFTILRNKLFLLNIVAALFNTVAYFIPVFFLTEFAIAANFSTSHGAFLVTVHGLAAIVARPLFGWLSDRKCVDELALYAALPLVEGLVVGCIPICSSYYWVLVLLCIFNGVLGTPFVSMIVAILSDLFGIENLSTAYGWWLLFNGIGILIGPPIAGWIYDVTESYDGVFYFSAGMLALCGVLLFLVSFLRCIEKPSPPNKDQETEVKMLEIENGNSKLAS